MNYLMSGSRGRSYTELFDQAMADGPFTDLYVAVAYATIGGVKLLDQTLMNGLGTGCHSIRKRWLVGIDWCRTDPPALDRLAALPRSEVRVPDGERVVSSRGCTPSRTFHPKIFIFTSPGRTAIVCGSGNLSVNGLSKGCEAGSIMMLKTEAGKTSDRAPADELLKWFRTEWSRASPYTDLAASYEAACRERVRSQRLVPTDDDAKPPETGSGVGGRALTEDQSHELRTFRNFWIDAGALGANLGTGVPGNQLDMKRFTRAFFGAPLDDLARQQKIDDVTLIWDGVPYADRTLKYGDNHMDKLNVPPAGDRGKPFYRGKTLLFSRRRDGAFDFQAGDAAQRRAWRNASQRSGVTYRLSPAREWGLF